MRAQGDLFERWQDSDNLVARVNLSNMRNRENRTAEVYALAVRGLFQLEPDEGKRSEQLQFIDICADLTENEFRHYFGTINGNTGCGTTTRASP